MIFILKVEEKREEGVQKIDDVREQIEWAIADKESKVEYQKWIESLRSKAFIKLF
jgi:parvulin-like peptidyl-prolyl isomerase